MAPEACLDFSRQTPAVWLGGASMIRPLLRQLMNRAFLLSLPVGPSATTAREPSVTTILARPGSGGR